MLKSIIGLSLLFFASFATADQWDFEVGQGTVDWGVLVGGGGTALTGTSLAYVKFDYLKLENNARVQRRTTIAKFYVALTTTRQDGRWHMVEKSKPHHMNPAQRNLSPGQKVSFEDIGFELPIPADLTNHWLTVEVELDNGNTVYAHSRRDIFKR